MHHLPRKSYASDPCFSIGYSLAELAIVLAIIGLIAGMSLSVGKVQMDVAEAQATGERLETIRQALLLFQMKYERYPCPALPADSSSSLTYGKEKANCATDCTGLTCDNSAVTGVVPFKTLRINEETAYDSWGGKITYSVDKNHTESSTFNTGGIPIKDLGGNEITSSPTLGDAIFVLVSHGKDGKGAYDKSGTVQMACGATGEDVENCNGDDVFADSRFILSDNPAAYYDDLIAWQTQENIQTQSTDKFGDGFQLGGGFANDCKGKTDGTVWCWGQNNDGEMGDGTFTDRPVPVQVSGLTNVVDGDVNDSHNCALKSDGTLWCWGSNGEGELGDGTAVDRPLPVQVSGLTDVRYVAVGSRHTCALKADGSLWCWGSNIYGQVGDGTTTSPRLLPFHVTSISNITQVTADEEHTCVRKADGTAWCWGHNENGLLGDGTTIDRLTPVQVSGLTNAASIEAGQHHVCALKTDGTAWCWGTNDFGHLGDGTTTHRYTPVQVSGLTGVTRIEAGCNHNCAVKNDGTVWCWGHGNNGRLGNGSTAQQNTPVQVSGLTDIIAVGAGDRHSCAEKSDGTVWCWGHRLYGRLGDGIDNGADQLTPVQALNFP